MNICIALSNRILSAAGACRVWFHSCVRGKVRSLLAARDGPASADVSNACRLGVEDLEEILLLIKAYIALVDRENMRRFTCRRDRFAYEAAIVLHHARRRLASSNAQEVLAVFAERTHGPRKGKVLLQSLEAEPRGDVQRQALEDLARFVVRRHRVRRRAAA